MLSTFNGKEVKHLLINTENQHNFVFDKRVTHYNPHKQCQQGTPNIDGDCTCEGATNSKPYYVEPEHFGIIYGATEPRLIQEPGPAARQLMKERSPLFMIRKD
jgi:hypothetical protein